MSLELFSERNILNSIALYFADLLLDWGYILYWHKIDAVQTPEGMYAHYSAQQTTYLTDSVFAARIAGSKGLATITEGETGLPRFLAPPTTDGLVSSAERVQLPTFAIEIGPDVPLMPYEHGSRLRWRVRSLLIEGRTRTREELQAFSDKLTQWFDDDNQIPIEDHDNVSGEDPDFARITRRMISKEVVADLGDTERFQLELNARLEFVA